MIRFPRTRLATVAWLVVAVLAVILLAPAPAARAEASIGCLLAEGATSTGSEMSVGSGMGFNVGEMIQIEITNPSEGTTTATLYAGETEVASGSAPGTLEYTIEDPAPPYLKIAVDGEATFAFSCTPAPTDSPEEPIELSEEDYCESGKAFGKHVSEEARFEEKMGKDGYKPGSHKGFSWCLHGEGFGR